MVRLGIEEEFILVDRTTLAPVPLGAGARDVLAAVDRPGEVSVEFLTCQIEHATSPVVTLEAAEAELREFRRHLSAHARTHDAIAASTGTPFATGHGTTVSESARYAHIARWLGHIAGGHQVCGLHVHVEIPDAPARVHALNALRPWLPVILALSGNAPFRQGRDTGFASWRTVMMRRLPTFGCPPLFHDQDHYAEHADRLVRTGAAPDIASLAWAARISDRYPTVEVRVCDSQLTVDDTLLVAALIRALLTSEHPPWEALDADDVNTSLWMAAREGLDARLVDPRDGRVTGARELVEALVSLTTARLREEGDLEYVQERLRMLAVEGTGADRQRAAHHGGGVDALAQRIEAAPEIAA